jgi:hypothetical protein
MDTVGEFPPWGGWPEAGQDEACWEGESVGSGPREEFANSIRYYCASARRTVIGGGQVRVRGNHVRRRELDAPYGFHGFRSR